MKYLLITGLIGFVLIVLGGAVDIFALHIIGVSLFGLVAVAALIIAIKEAVQDETI